MKLTILLLAGAAVLAMPAYARSTNQAAGADNSSAATSQTANETAQAPANDASTSQSANASSSANGQMAMNNGSSASANTTGDASAVSSVPDTQKKYKRSARARDFQKEAETTKQLNQQMASADGATQMQR